MVSVMYDREANAMYVKVDDKKKIKKTISLGEDRFMDVDESGHVIGIEVLLPKEIPQEAQEALFRSKDKIELLR